MRDALIIGTNDIITRLSTVFLDGFLNGFFDGLIHSIIVACVIILEDGQKKKVKLQTGLQDELLLALSSLTSVSDDTLIEMYDEEVNDFIDLEPDTPVHNKAKINLSRKLKPQADECVKLAWYPSRELYRTAAERLVYKYPHLADKLGAKTSGLDSWVPSLRIKFKNMRKKVKNCPREMAEKWAESPHKRPRQPQGDILNKTLCRLFKDIPLIPWLLREADGGLSLYIDRE
ncbi:hypothetical protein MRX96_001117 [Rhipicephalus microplus]